MISSRNRLSRPEFTTLSSDRSSRRLSTTHFSAILSQTVPFTGAAVVVSKKVAKTSVSRHLLKRRIRVCMRIWCTKAAIIIFAKAGSKELTFSELQAEISQLLSQHVK